MLNTALKALKDSNTICIYSHINVDCDAMGSSLALKEGLELLGKKVDVFVNSNFPNNFSFYGDLSYINQKTIEGKYDLVVCLDCVNESRLGKYKFSYKKGIKNSLNIDHHLSNENYCKINYVINASSTAEILFDVLKELKIMFTPFMCKCLISGIVTDTGRFSHSTSVKTFNIVAKLLKYGNLTMEDIINPLFNSMKMEVFYLLQKAYQTIEFYSDNKLAIIMLSNSDFKETGATLDDTDIFPDIPLQLENVQFAILASEDDKGYFRVSLRSKGDISARKVAESFGGGGHLNASGCKIFGGFDEVKDKLINSTIEILGWKND